MAKLKKKTTKSKATKAKKFSDGGKATSTTTSAANKKAFDSGMKDLKSQKKAAHKLFQDNPTKRTLANLLAVENAQAKHERKFAKHRINRDSAAFFEYITERDLKKFKNQILKNN